MVTCKACGGETPKGAAFVLTGSYPGVAKRYFNWAAYGLDDYGDCYHNRATIERSGDDSRAPLAEESGVPAAREFPGQVLEQQVCVPRRFV